MEKEKFRQFIKEYNKGKKIFNDVKMDEDNFFELMYGLANNCPKCHWFPCTCKQYNEWRNKNE